MTGVKYVVGFAPGQGGIDAVALGSALSLALGAELHIAFVVKAEDPYGGGPNARDYTLRVEQRAREWLTDAAALVPEDVPFELHLHVSINAPAGLMELADDLGAAAIVVGTTEADSWTAHGLGAVDNALLHRAEVPVILAPRGYPGTTAITRISCAVSPSVDAIGLVEEAIATGNRTGLPLRLVALLESQADPDRARSVIEQMVADSSITADAPDQLEIVIGQGPTVARAIEDVTWRPDAVLMVGSSKLAQKGQIFLSSTAAKIVTAIPVPIVMVPRDYHPGRGGSRSETWTGSIPVVQRERR